MRNVRNITVAVSDDLYRQTRRLAAEYDTTVTAMVVYLLQRLPAALDRGAAQKLRAANPPLSAAAPANQDVSNGPSRACAESEMSLAQSIEEVTGGVDHLNNPPPLFSVIVIPACTAVIPT